MNTYLRRDGDVFVPTDGARGPWGDSLSGRVLGGLLGSEVERVAGKPEFRPARLTVDLLRPTCMAPLTIHVEVLRDGRRLRLADVRMTQQDKVAARATALFLRPGEHPQDAVWSSPVAMPPLPSEPAEIPDDLPIFMWIYGRDHDAPGRGLVEWQQSTQQKFAWIKETQELVEGEPLSPFTRAAMAGDVTSSMTHYGTGGLNYINADYTVSLSRLPEGPYVGLAALTHYGHDGIATGTASMFDERGPIGSTNATALAHGGFSPPPAANSGSVT